MSGSVDIAIVGAGPAGLSAAIEAARCGARVSVFDENVKPGGQLFKQIHKFFGSGRHSAGVRGIHIGKKLVEEAAAQGVECITGATVLGIFPGPKLAIAFEDKTAGVISAKRILLATGATENAVCFPGWTLPGVMGAGAAQTILNLYRVLPGKRILMIGSGNVGLIVSYQLLQGGAEVVAVVEVAPSIGGYGVHADKLVRAGVEILLSHIVIEAKGENHVESVTVAEVDRDGKVKQGTEREFVADSICMATGLSPMAELARMAGCRVVYVRELGGYIPWHDRRMQTSILEIYVAGDITGVEEASTAMEKGRIAGLSMAEDMGFISFENTKEQREETYDYLQNLRSGPLGEPRACAYQKLYGDRTVIMKECEDMNERKDPPIPPAIPTKERMAEGPIVMIECFQEIPCNPCETDCLRGAITIGTPITRVPILDEEKCNGCARCVPRCPGLSIFWMDATFSDKEALLGFPYEFLPYPKKNQEVILVNRSGTPVGRGRVRRISKPVDGTVVIYAIIPKDLIQEARGIQRLEQGENDE